MRILNWAGWLVVVGLGTLRCGGRVETALEPPSSTADAGPIPASTGGSAGSAEICDDAGLGEGGCVGESGGNANDPSMPLRAPCGSSVIVNRHGVPVPICF